MMRAKKWTRSQSARTCSTPRRSGWILISLGIVSVVMAVVVFRPWPFPAADRVEAGQIKSEVAEGVTFRPTIANTGSVPAPPPQGMVWIPGGEFSMGAIDPPATDEVGMQAAADARPVHRVYVDSFWMDATDVTNEEFARFVEATGYVTVAERTPTAKEF